MHLKPEDCSTASRACNEVSHMCQACHGADLGCFSLSYNNVFYLRSLSKSEYVSQTYCQKANQLACTHEHIVHGLQYIVHGLAVSTENLPVVENGIRQIGQNLGFWGGQARIPQWVRDFPPPPPDGWVEFADTIAFHAISFYRSVLGVRTGVPSSCLLD
jgi:hypothetical protein